MVCHTEVCISATGWCGVAWGGARGNVATPPLPHRCGRRSPWLPVGLPPPDQEQEGRDGEDEEERRVKPGEVRMELKWLQKCFLRVPSFVFFFYLLFFPYRPPGSKSRRRFMSTWCFFFFLLSLIFPSFTRCLSSYFLRQVGQLSPPQAAETMMYSTTCTHKNTLIITKGQQAVRNGTICTDKVTCILPLLKYIKGEVHHFWNCAKIPSLQKLRILFFILFSPISCSSSPGVGNLCPRAVYGPWGHLILPPI